MIIKLQWNFFKKEIKFDEPIYLGSTVLELSKLHMHDLFHNVLQQFLEDLQLHYMDTDSFVLSSAESNVADKYMDLSNLDTPTKTISKSTR